MVEKEINEDKITHGEEVPPIQFKDFYIDEYIKELQDNCSKTDASSALSVDKHTRFHILCEAVRKYFNEEWNNEASIAKKDASEKMALLLERQKKAIIGYPIEVNFFKDKIKEYLKANNLLDESYPLWYLNLIDAIYHENWGLAGIAEWLNIPESSSAKIIGERIWFLINGKEKLMEQSISPERFEQLRQALLLKTPKLRYDQNYFEIYMHSGERIAIYCGDLVPELQHSMVFRKYVVKNYTFEEQALKGTIPKEALPLLKAFPKIGYNIALLGAVRTGKTTFLNTFLSHVDPSLEGLLIQTDPEILIHKILPDSPILSLLASGEKLPELKKNILRSDADYIVMAEARDGHSFDIVVEAANKGTMGCITCAHLSDPTDFCFEVANKILAVSGGKIDYHIVRTAKSYHYLFEFIQLKDKSKKRLKSIYEMRFDRQTFEISFHQICRYERNTDSWTFKYDVGEDKAIIGNDENAEAYSVFDSELKKLAAMYPMQDNNVYYPVYSKVGVIVNAN